MKQKKIVLDKKLKLDYCRSEIMDCVECNKPIGEGKWAFSMNNYTDVYTEKGVAPRDKYRFKKSLWVHFGCMPNFADAIMAAYKKHRAEIFAKSI